MMTNLNEACLTPNEREEKPKSLIKRYKCCLIALVVVMVTFVIGILIGYFSHPRYPLHYKAYTGVESWVRNRLLSDIDAYRLKFINKEMSKKPHLAGTLGNRDLADYVAGKWNRAGLDHVEIKKYNVLLSYPKQPGSVKFSGDSNLDFTVENERSIGLEEIDSDTVLPYAAYSPSGTVTGDVIYVNYGRAEDFDFLKQLGINPDGKICVARFGRGFRGVKAHEAAARKCVGLIVYSDPQGVAPGNPPPSALHPDGVYLPPTGVQRGTYMLHTGDPQTPGIPSTDYAYRKTNTSNVFPSIPVIPMGYGQAKIVLEQLKPGNESLPTSWIGEIAGLKYNTGPGYGTTKGKVTIETNNVNVVKEIYNVIGYIYGSVESDRYVMIGSHRDSWVRGAIDAGSGTTLLMELARVFGGLRKDGWSPRRTLMFESWDGEEFGMLGSAEWVEEYQQELAARGVAYINVDMAVWGNYSLQVKATGNLQDIVTSAANEIQTPEGENFRDVWARRQRERDMRKGGNMTVPGEYGVYPHVYTVSASSDFAHFINYAGVSVMDLQLQAALVPTYHTAYDTHRYFEFIDPEFHYHRMMAQLAGLTLLRLVDDVILPLNVDGYAATVFQLINGIDTDYKITKNVSEWSKGGIYSDLVENLKDSLQNLSVAARKLEATKKTINKYDAMAVRRLNDKLSSFERNFIIPLGITGNPTKRHVVYSGGVNNYGSTGFAGILDAFKQSIEHPGDMETRAETFRQISQVIFAINSAAHSIITGPQY